MMDCSWQFWGRWWYKSNNCNTWEDVQLCHPVIMDKKTKPWHPHLWVVEFESLLFVCETLSSCHNWALLDRKAGPCCLAGLHVPSQNSPTFNDKWSCQQVIRAHTLVCFSIQKMKYYHNQFSLLPLDTFIAACILSMPISFNDCNTCFCFNNVCIANPGQLISP